LNKDFFVFLKIAGKSGCALYTGKYGNCGEHLLAGVEYMYCSEGVYLGENLSWDSAD